MAELREVRRTVEEIHSRPTIGKILFRLIDRLLDPKVIVSLAFMLAVSGILVGRALTIEGFGLTISTEEKANAQKAAKAEKSHAKAVRLDPDSDPVIHAVEARDDREFDVGAKPTPLEMDSGHD